ncbi:hypothetical protein [Bacteroides helcogenes]|uniref:Uncharacterized protein n=1 Tax=Bacteroides helcogenes (strain ATCC 35417 / DSM 20613 / JCM 6297 / CCUG 15421 / P 36-108) TaxID=693979 RepID=E6SWE7_BACT6|nr:hypothetical protein [Bacteroides helcogenes]ADV44608.1 hypothetical protein Bache_2656 [Bacteroides helcogenes P 36-108]MDY5238899.1 hypothetical protein [Bacteroides helcogenes]
MERGIITMNEAGTVTIPKTAVWMTKFEMADMFGVFSGDIRKAIHAIYRNKELDESETMLYVRQPDGVSLDTYGIEMVIAIAFRIRSSGSIRFRKFITDKMCSRNGNSSVSLFIPCGNKSNPWYN